MSRVIKQKIIKDKSDDSMILYVSKFKKVLQLFNFRQDPE